MPLLLLVGTPGAGKSELARQLVEHLQAPRRSSPPPPPPPPIELISDDEFFAAHDRNRVFRDAALEKQLRGFLKSAVQRKLRADNLVLLDSSNYIKGFRYELYCLAKEHKSTHCLLQVTLPREETLRRNALRTPAAAAYAPDVLDALLLRYESPQSQNRWDSPLFNTLGAPHLPTLFDQLEQALLHSRPPPPNQSTQSLPTSASNFLQEVDRRTRSVVDRALQAQQLGAADLIRLPGCELPLRLGAPATVGQQSKHRRQFLTFVKSHPVQPDAIEKSFVQYLNTSFAGERD